MPEDVEKLEKEICLFLSTPLDFGVGKYTGDYHGNIRTMEYSKLIYKRRMSVTRSIKDFKARNENRSFNIKKLIESLIFFSEYTLNYKTLETIQTLAEEVIFKFNEEDKTDY